MHLWGPSRWKLGQSGLLRLFAMHLWGPSRLKEDLLGLMGLYNQYNRNHSPLEPHFARSGRSALVALALPEALALLEGRWVLEALPPSKQALRVPWGLSAPLPGALQDLQRRGPNLHVDP